MEIRDIGSLPVQFLNNDDEIKEKLRVRGQKFVELIGRHYLDYKGSIIQDHSDQGLFNFPKPVVPQPPRLPDQVPWPQPNAYPPKLNDPLKLNYQVAP